MENVDIKEGFNFRLTGTKTLAVQSGVDGVYYCPFCYSQTAEAETKCKVCNKNFPQLIYYHSDDDTWIASGNEE